MENEHLAAHAVDRRQTGHMAPNERLPRIEYHPEVDAAYVHFANEILVGGVKTIPVDPQAIKGTVNLDIDVEGRIIGLEVLDASKLLPHELLPR